MATSLLPSSAAPESAVSLRTRIAQSLAGFFATASERRLRRMALDAARVAAAAGLALVCALGLTLAHLAWQVHHGARDVSQAALAFVDAQLDVLNDQLSRVALHPALQHPWDSCPPDLTALLVHESLSSLLVRQLTVSAADGRSDCGPAGALPPLELPVKPQPRLALVTQRSIDRQLVVLRATPSGHGLAAMLDPRSFNPGSDSDQHWARSTLWRITLVSADERPLLRWGVSAPPNILVPQQMAASTRYQVGVAVQADADALHALVWQRALLAAVLTMLLVATAVAWAWRRALDRARLYRRLVLALRKRQFEPYVQPIVDVASGCCVGGEVLMRWLHPQRGVLGPVEFIEEAERTGLIIGMSELVMARAAHRLAPLAQAHPELYFSFNVTPEQLRAADFAQQLSELFRADTLRREQVLLELTEREFVDPLASRTLISLRAAGWRIAIDDFGTGQSSLATIERLPIDRIKIDRAFVSTIDEGTVSRPVLDTIIALAKKLQIALIAEGVETRSQWDYLAARQVQCVQGYLIARPMPIDAFVRWVSQRQVAKVAVPNLEADLAMRALCERMAAQLDIRNRSYRLREYERCFVGREAIDWLGRDQRVGRGEALRIARRLVALSLVRHVVDEHDFEDAELFYQLVAQRREQAEPGVPATVDITQALNSANGLPWRDHVRGLLRHRQCASGRSIVGWLAERYAVPRPIALAWAAQLMCQGRLRHIFDDEPFRDDHTLYRPG